jgi:hypothetical protein
MDRQDDFQFVPADAPSRLAHRIGFGKQPLRRCRVRSIHSPRSADAFKPSPGEGVTTGRRCIETGLSAHQIRA